MTLQEAAQTMKRRLQDIYEPRESANITEWVMEYVTGLPRIDRITRHGQEMDDEQGEKWKDCLAGLMEGRPVQYVTGYAWFMGLRFRVNEDVLIPRPETEELVDWVVQDLMKPGPSKEMTILDIGTGSGCIPILLKYKFPRAVVHTVDISPAAIQVARENAVNLETEIIFHQADFLDAGARETLPSADIMISNPPYVPLKDSRNMSKNVLAFEPHLALFVPDEDPLVFYRAIAEYGRARLREGGAVYLEIHEQYARALSEVVESLGYLCETRWDMQGKDRMMKLVRS